MKKQFIILLGASVLTLSSCFVRSIEPVPASNSDRVPKDSTEASSELTSEPTSESSAASSLSSSSSKSSSTSRSIVIGELDSVLNSKFLSPKFGSDGSISTTSYDSDDLKTYYFVGYDKVPYVLASDAFDLAHSFSPLTRFSYENGVYKATNSIYLPENFEVDANTNTITFSDYEHFIANAGTSGTAIAMASCGEPSWYSYLKLQSSELLDDDRSLTFDLGDYDVQIISYDGKVYVPAGHMLGILFGSDYPVGFNGDNYYLAYEDILYEGSLAYTKKVYGGSYSNLTTRDSDFAAYNYSHLCFMFDHFYGLAADSDLLPFDSTFERTGYKSKLLSSNISTYNQAIFDFVEEVLDEGHSHADYKSYYQTSKATTGRALVSGDRNSEIEESYTDVYFARGRQNQGYFTSGDVAVLRFDLFQDYFDEDYFDYTSNPSSDYFDVYAFFYKSFEQITANSSITKVVIDLSLNGGGEVGALYGAIGFLGGSFTTSIFNPLTGSVMHETYMVDTNLDGKFNSSDGYQGQYDFYILTSGYSYSCASFMSELCKENNIATPIGHKSGGGACSVGYFSTLDGAMGWMSSNMLSAYEAGDGSYINYEHGYPVESAHQFDYSDYFNLNSLANHVDNF